MLQKPPKAKGKLYNRDKVIKLNSDEEDKENKGIRKFIKGKVYKREFGKDIGNNTGRSISSSCNSNSNKGCAPITNAITMGTIDYTKRQSLSKDNNANASIKRREIGGYCKQFSATHVNNSISNSNTYNNYNDKDKDNGIKSKSMKQLKEPMRMIVNKKTIETLIYKKANSIRNSVCLYSIENNSNANSNSNLNSIKSNNNTNSTSNINHKIQRNFASTTTSPILASTCPSQNRLALTLVNQSTKNISQFDYEDKKDKKPKVITTITANAYTNDNSLNPPIQLTKTQEGLSSNSYTVLFHNNLKDKENHIEIPKEQIKPHKKDSIQTQVLFNTLPLNNPQYPIEYINTIYLNLLTEENSLINTQRAIFDYMKYQPEITDSMRSILADWLIDVHLKFKFTEETLYTTINIIDRYLSIQNVSKSKLQLVGISALMIACKHEEIDLPKVKDYLYITDNAYTKEELFKMEYHILSRLQFNFLIPSPLKFYEILSTGFAFNSQQICLGKYLMETFLIDIRMLKYKASIIACACAYIVMKFSKMENYACSYDRKYYTLGEGDIVHYSVKDCAKDICLFVDNINKTQYNSALKKYSRIEYEKVAMLILGK